jgi:hypothetical protein
MKSIRFTGLVRLANGIQRELCGGVAERRREELREQVQRAVELVESTLGAYGANLKAVPGPTRRAYEFLRTIDFDDIPNGDDDSMTTHRQVVLRGLVANVEQIADRLARIALDPAPLLAEVCGSIARVSNPMERLLRRLNLGAEALTPRSREHLAWVRWIAGSSHVAEYLAAVRRANALFESHAGADRWPRPIVVHFRPTQSVFRVRADVNCTRVLLPTPMITLHDADFVNLAHSLFGRRSRRNNAALHAILLAEPYQALRVHLEALGGAVEETRGMVHDLAQSFERVNSTYFSGEMPRPRLTWNRSITAGKFGHYHYATDTVMISRSLDRPYVPSFVVDHVMHHELLHKKHGLHWRHGRGQAHTRDFRREEREFVQYRSADEFLQSLARKNGRR